MTGLWGGLWGVLFPDEDDEDDEDEDGGLSWQKMSWVPNQVGLCF